MASESALTTGAAANMVAGESASSIKTSNGETKVSCIDPKDKSNDLGGFELPDMDDDDNEGGCTGASVCLYNGCIVGCFLCIKMDDFWIIEKNVFVKIILIAKNSKILIVETLWS